MPGQPARSVLRGGRGGNVVPLPDTEGTLKKIEAAGGQVLTPRTDIAPGAGAFAVFADPAGAEFGLYEEPKR